MTPILPSPLLAIPTYIDDDETSDCLSASSSCESLSRICSENNDLHRCNASVDVAGDFGYLVEHMH